MEYTRQAEGLSTRQSSLTHNFSTEALLATKKLASHRVNYSKEDIRQLKALIKAKTPMTAVGKAMGRTAAGVRMKAVKLGILPRRGNKTATKGGKAGRR